VQRSETIVDTRRFKDSLQYTDDAWRVIGARVWRVAVFVVHHFSLTVPFSRFLDASIDIVPHASIYLLLKLRAFGESMSFIPPLLAASCLPVYNSFPPILHVNLFGLCVTSYHPLPSACALCSDSHTSLR
jgi:hypothetical protein